MASSELNSAASNTSGQSTAKVEFVPALEGDLFTDLEMAEIARRLIVKLVGIDTSGVVSGPTPPARKDVAWIPTDDNGIPIGPIRTYNPATGQWEDTANEEPPDGSIEDLVSEDENNAIGFGSDGKLYVPTLQSVGQVWVEVIDATGDPASIADPVEYGIANSPFTTPDQYHVSITPRGSYTPPTQAAYIVSKQNDKFTIKYEGDMTWEIGLVPLQLD